MTAARLTLTVLPSTWIISPVLPVSTTVCVSTSRTRHPGLLELVGADEPADRVLDEATHPVDHRRHEGGEARRRPWRQALVGERVDGVLRDGLDVERVRSPG